MVKKTIVELIDELGKDRKKYKQCSVCNTIRTIETTNCHICNGQEFIDVTDENINALKNFMKGIVEANITTPDKFQLDV